MTETLDKLFLELSQITTAKTAKELELELELNRLQAIFAAWEDGHLRNGLDHRTLRAVNDMFNQHWTSTGIT